MDAPGVSSMMIDVGSGFQTNFRTSQRARELLQRNYFDQPHTIDDRQLSIESISHSTYTIKKLVI
jgi:hypothetical protein